MAVKVSPLTVPRATTCEPTTTSPLVAAVSLPERVVGRAVDRDGLRLAAATARAVSVVEPTAVTLPAAFGVGTLIEVIV